MNQLRIADCLARSAQLVGVSSSPRLDVELLLSQVLQKNRTFLLTWPETMLSEPQQILFDDFFARRLAGEPVAHIRGLREFWSLDFIVNNSTLIPRPDTELLVEAVLQLFAQDHREQSRRLLDLGTGTGAIVLSIAHEKKFWQCVGLDKEIAAIELAEINRRKFLLENVTLLQSDWFSALAANELFDVIVSNPPYIDPADPHLHQGDLRFEPSSALVAEKNGLADIEIICQQAPAFLHSQGWLLIEHGYDQGQAVRELFSAAGFIHCNTLRDYGDNERVTLGRLP